MATGIAGLRGTGSYDASAPTGSNVAERPTNFREMILWRDPNGGAPLTALMSKMRTESTDDPQFNWYEEELSPVRVRLTGGPFDSTASTTFSCYTTASFNALDVRAGDLFMVEATTPAAGAHFEIVQVTQDPTASNVFTATRAYGGSTIVSIAVSSYLVKIGSSFAEGASSPTATSRTPSRYHNYTQIFKTAYNLTNTAKVTKLRTGDPLKNEKKRKMFDHSSALEFAWLFGIRTETSGTSYGSTQPQRTTGGLFWWLATGSGTSYVATIASTLTQEDFLDATYSIFDYGYTGAGNERIVLCGNGFLNRLNKVILSDSATNINYDGTINAFGMNLMKWVIPQGTFYLRTHPMMNVNSKFTNAAFFINPAAIIYRPLTGRDTKFQDNIQNPDDDEIKGQWLTEAGIEVHHLKTMKYLEIIQ